jgi:hypothetical protein
MEASRQTDRVNVSGVVSEMFSIYGAQAAVLLGSALVIFLAVGLAQGLLATADSVILSLIGSIIYLIGVTLYSGMVVKVVDDVRDGRRDLTVGEIIGSVTPVLGALIGNGILKAIAVVIGLVLLIVPGLILLTIWAVTGPAIVVERQGAIDAFGRSRELVRGEGFSVFAVLAVTLLIVIGISIVVAIIGAATGDAGQVIFGIVGSVLTAPIFSLVSAILFFDLGGGKDAVTAPAAAAEPPPPPAAPAA